MLDELLVENLGLIETARIEPGPGLVAITGETGAGKTLLLGALQLLRGDTARLDRIGPKGDEARVEGRFLIDGDETVLGRRVSGSRSRAYVDGSLSTARGLGERLRDHVEIVGQNEHVRLGRPSYSRSVLDSALDATGREARETYGAAWARWTQLTSDLAELGGDRRALERERDLAQHQANEITSAAPSETEEQELDEQLERLRHVTEIETALASVRDALIEDGAAEDLVGRAISALGRVAEHDARLDALATTLQGVGAEIADAAAAARRIAETLDHDPATLVLAEERKALLNDLKRKYGASVEEVLAFAGSQRARADELKDLLDRADRIDSEMAAARDAVDAAGETLRAARLRAAKELGASAEGHLKDLGFRHPVIEFSVAAAEPGVHGADRIEVRFASDESLTPGPVGRVASGGELSRVVLAIRLASGIGDVAVVAFDEIDAGIGGATALMMGEKLSSLAGERQVFVVTHLPQVAAFADTHIVVEREGARASITTLAAEQRVEELARMLGGLGESEGGQLHATELVTEATRRKSG